MSCRLGCEPNRKKGTEEPIHRRQHRVPGVGSSSDPANARSKPDAYMKCDGQQSHSPEPASLRKVGRRRALRFGRDRTFATSHVRYIYCPPVLELFLLESFVPNFFSASV